MPKDGAWIQVDGASKGPEATKRIVKNHKSAIEELQKSVDDINDALDEEGEDTAFLGVLDADIVEWTVKAILTDTDIP